MQQTGSSYYWNEKRVLVLQLRKTGLNQYKKSELYLHQMPLVLYLLYQSTKQMNIKCKYCTEQSNGHVSLPSLLHPTSPFPEEGSEQDMRFILPNAEKRPYPQDLNHANIFTTAASRLSVSDLPQLLVICRKLPQTKTTLLLPLHLFLPCTMPPIQRSFSLLLPPSPNSLSQQPLLCRPHTWRAESRPIWQAQITTKKGKKRKKEVVFWPRRLLCIFIWREQSNLFSFHQEPKGMAMDPKASHSHKSALTKIRGKGWYFWTHRHL